MSRITVATFPDKSVRFHPIPYETIPGASLVQYPEVPDDTVARLEKSTPKEVYDILSKFCNF